MQNSDWPFPSKPHPASLGSGLMGNHGYRPHTSPPSFFPRERNWSEGVVGAVHIVTCLPLYPWSLSDHSIFIKLSITMHVLVPHSSPVARRGINEAQILLAASGWLFLFLHWTRPKNLWFASHKHKEWKEKKQKKQASFCWDVVAVFLKSALQFRPTKLGSDAESSFSCILSTLKDSHYPDVANRSAFPWHPRL